MPGDPNGNSAVRSTVAAWLLASGHARDVAEAIVQVRSARRGVVLGPAYAAALERYAHKLEARQP